MKPIALLLFAILATVAGALYVRASTPHCPQDSLAELYAQELSNGWRTTLTSVFVDLEAGRLESQGHTLNALERERLTDGYRPIVERFYGKDFWLPGVRDYVDEHLSHGEQCAALAYYGTATGRKVLLMQLAPGGLEFVRQQATNRRRADPQFASERLEMLGTALPNVDKAVRESGRVP